MVIEQSQSLTDFYRAYLGWVRTGAPQINQWNFERHMGLCCNLFVYRQAVPGIDPDEFSDQLETYSPSMYPFGGWQVYRKELQEKTMHLNPERLLWVITHAMETP